MSELERITARLEQLAEELGADPGEERAAELVAEASKLAAEAGAEVERALRGAAEATRRVSEYPEDLRELVDDYLAGLSFCSLDATAGLEEAMRYSLLAGGKRIRPVLALATARAIGLEPERVLPAAAAIELIHTYSLIHDDLPAMDDDELRRGMPTSHVKFGENVAILAGDGLFAEAMRLYCERQEGEPDRVVAALGELVAATGVGGMVGGQYVDVTTFDPRNGGAADADPEALRQMHSLKTGPADRLERRRRTDSWGHART